jgi:YihY family inner membrane protein
VDVHAPVARLDAFQRRHRIVAFPAAVIKRFGEDGAGRLAATIAYYGFFSLFPLLLVLVTVTSLILQDDPGLQDRLLDSAIAQFPVVGDQIRSSVGSIQGSGLALAIGLLTALWAGLGGVRSARFAMDSVWDVPYHRRPSTPRAIGWSLLTLGTLGVFLLASAILGGLVGGSGSRSGGGWSVLASWALNVLLFLVIYRLLTVAEIGWRDVWPGALLAGTGWTLLLVLGGWIVGNRLESASDVYGFFAVVIGLLAWLHLGAQLTLLGAEVNVVRSRRAWPRSFDPAHLTRADREVLDRLILQQRRKEEQTVSITYETNGDRGSRPDPRDRSDRRRSMPELIASVLDRMRGLVRKEVELARIEMTEAVAARAKGLAAFGVGGVALLFALGFLAAGAALALAIVLPAWAATLIVGGVFLLIGVICLLVGRRTSRSASFVPERTQESLKEDLRWAQQRIAS